MARTLGTVSLVLGDRVLVKVRGNTLITDLLDQLDKVCKGGTFKDADGFDVLPNQEESLPAGQYTVEQPIAGKPDGHLFWLSSKWNKLCSCQLCSSRAQHMCGRLLFASQNAVSMHMPGQAMYANTICERKLATAALCQQSLCVSQTRCHKSGSGPEFAVILCCSLCLFEQLQRLQCVLCLA